MLVWEGYNSAFSVKHITKKYYIYALSEDKHSPPFYIGKGTGRRCVRHHIKRKGRKLPVTCKIESLSRHYYVKILSESDNEDVIFALERAFIAKFKRRFDGGTLLNLTLGGKGTGRECLVDDTYRVVKTRLDSGKGKPIFVEGFIFPSKRQASRSLGKDRNHINFLIMQGRAFSLEDEQEVLKKSEYYLTWLERENRKYLQAVAKSKVKTTTNRPVWIDGVIYSSAVEAARETGVTPSAIQNRIYRGNQKNTYYLDQLQVR